MKRAVFYEEVVLKLDHFLVRKGVFKIRANFAEPRFNA